MAEKKAEIPRNFSNLLEKVEEKGKIPRLVLDLGKILPKVSSSPDDPSRTSGDFCNFFASQWYSRWLVGVSTFPINPAEQFGMQYLPPGGWGRSSESFLYH